MLLGMKYEEEYFPHIDFISISDSFFINVIGIGL